MVSYELARRLKDSGFPQDRGVYFYLHIPAKKIYDKARDVWFNRQEHWKLLPWGKKTGVVNETVAAPFLEELIKECGGHFRYLILDEDGKWRCWGVEKELQGRYETPEESVINLYERIHEHPTN